MRDRTCRKKRRRLLWWTLGSGGRTDGRGPGVSDNSARVRGMTNFGRCYAIGPLRIRLNVVKCVHGF